MHVVTVRVPLLRDREGDVPLVVALEIELVKKALEKTRGQLTRAAELFGVSRFGPQKMRKRLRLQKRGDK